MSKIYYSATTGGFYFEDDRALYDDAGTWPADANEISQRWYEYLLSGQLAGKSIVPDAYGSPVLVATEIDYVAEAERMKAQLMAAAEAAIAPLKRAVKYSMATDAEKASLEQWEVYSVLLSRVDTLLAPDIEWPPVPA
ncbi:tail fiber assembly protein [Enterobacter kobei]|nr:tail fiber assembly protein [Enterobacter kobei]